MTVAELEEKYLVENKYTKMIPSYLRDYPKFIKLMKMFSNYVQESCDVIEKILSKLKLSKATGDILEKIAERLNISIEKPLDEYGNVNQWLYEQQLKIAILGNGLKRTSKASRESLSKITQIFDSIVRYEITDFSNSEGHPYPMTVQVDVMGTADVWSREMLEKYVLPNITGIGTVINYVLYNNMYFGFDRHDVIEIIGTINLGTSSVTQSALYTKAAELGYALEDLKLGITITDSENNGWVFINPTVGWENRANVENGQGVFDPAVGYGIQGWDKGQWTTTTVIE